MTAITFVRTLLAETLKKFRREALIRMQQCKSPLENVIELIPQATLLSLYSHQKKSNSKLLEKTLKKLNNSPEESQRLWWRGYLNPFLLLGHRNRVIFCRLEIFNAICWFWFFCL